MARKTALNILMEIDESPQKSLIRDKINSAKLSSADMRLVWELVNGTLKNLSLLDFVLNKFIKKNPTLFIQYVLRIAIYQILFTRIPDYAVVDESIKIVKKSKFLHQAKFVNAVLRNVIRNIDVIREELSAPDLPDEIRYSLPSWMIKRYKFFYGEEIASELFKIVSRPPLLAVRVRENNCSLSDFTSLLDQVKISFETINDSLWINILDKEKFWKNNFIEKSFCSVQDFSSGVACRLFKFENDVIPKVLDMCAAPGGKSLQILDYLSGRGHLTANEISPERITRLSDNLMNSQNTNFTITNQNGLNIDGEYTHILIDAPCSGLGTLRKNADLRWNKTLSMIKEFRSLQYLLLEKAAKLLVKNGEIVYSTCSIDPEENEEVVNEFLLKNKDFEIDIIHQDGLKKFAQESGAYLLLPEKSHDGAYAVKLIKSG